MVKACLMPSVSNTGSQGSKWEASTNRSKPAWYLDSFTPKGQVLLERTWCGPLSQFLPVC